MDNVDHQRNDYRKQREQSWTLQQARHRATVKILRLRESIEREHWYTAEMMTDPIEFPIFRMELADTILRKVRHKGIIPK